MFRKIAIYIFGFLFIGVLYGFYSYLFDLFFYRIEYNSTNDYKGSPIAYFIFFIIGYVFISLPAFIFYNWSMTMFFKSKAARIITAFIIGLVIGLLIGRAGNSYYIGNLRWLKNSLTFALTAATFELIAYKRSIENQPK